MLLLQMKKLISEEKENTSNLKETVFHTCNLPNISMFCDKKEKDGCTRAGLRSTELCCGQVGGRKRKPFCNCQNMSFFHFLISHNSG